MYSLLFVFLTACVLLSACVGVALCASCRDTYALMFGTPLPEAAHVVDATLGSAPKVLDGGLSLLDSVSKSFGLS